MSKTLRNSGIPFIDDVPWGSHLCLFYETHDDLLEAAVRFFEQGLDGNELCVWAVPGALPLDAVEKRLRAELAGFDDHLVSGRMRLLPTDWRVGSDGDFERAVAFWDALLGEALAGGFDGLRGSGDGFWLGGHRHDDVAGYEQAIADLVADRPALGLCTYDLSASRGIDVLDIARLHTVTVARRRGDWQLFEAPPLRSGAFESDPLAADGFPGQDQLTERERAVLALLLKGASAKEMARDLGISPRTVEFHRANIIGKLGARNTADLVRRVLGGR